MVFIIVRCNFDNEGKVISISKLVFAVYRNVFCDACPDFGSENSCKAEFRFLTTICCERGTARIHNIWWYFACFLCFITNRLTTKYRIVRR